LAKRAVFALSSGQVSSAELLAARALTIGPRPDALGVVASLAPETQPRLEKSEAFTTHCKHIAPAAQRGVLACASDQRFVVVDDGKARVLGEHQDEVTAVAASSGGERLYSADRSGVLRW